MDKSRCPICGEANHCALEAGKEASECWCMSLHVPKGLLESLSESQKNSGCICKKCIKAYTQLIKIDKTVQSLNGLWQMKKDKNPQTYEAHIPGSMYYTLYNAGAIENPFTENNDLLQLDLSDDNCVFERTFDMDHVLINREHLELVCYGLDTLATIYINDKLLAETNNMHRTYIFDIREYVNEGENHIRIQFASPLDYIERKQQENPLWGVAQTVPGYEYIRKAHHMFGWDWGPKLPDMGIWRDIEILGYDKGLIEEIYIEQKQCEEAVELNISSKQKLFDERLSLEVDVFSPEGACIYRKKYEASAENRITLTIEEPEIWWPNGYGEQPLYEVVVKIKDEDMYIIDQQSKTIGIRSLTVVREADSYGETFDFEINGMRIFAMGADYIPEDVFITRPDYSRTELFIKDCVEAGYNTIRVWGGGIYPSDTFYDLCDTYGLIVWQDFMFACGVYPMDPPFVETISQEIVDNIKRLRHHASLGLWCGNNEMEWGFEEWDVNPTPAMRQDYLDLYEKLIPGLLEEHDPKRFYWPASPSSGGGFKDPNGDASGDVHYWTVFHGNEHYKMYRKHYFRFASEYGMQSFPSYKTLTSYIKGDYNPFSFAMENHNKCIDPINGNMKILHNLVWEFKLPNNTKDLAFVSQVMQAEAIKTLVEHLRRHRGRCMGSTYWQVNDNYPGPSWSSIDFYGRWKLLHYAAKRFYGQVLLSAYESGSEGYLAITNDCLTPFTGCVKWQLRHVDLGIIQESKLEVMIDASSAKIIDTVQAEALNKTYLTYQLLDDKEVYISSGSLLFVSHKHFEFKTPTLSWNIFKGNEHYYVKVKSSEYVRYVTLDFTKTDAIFSDNGFDLYPGEERVIQILSFRQVDVDKGTVKLLYEDQLSLDTLKSELEITSLSTCSYMQ